MRIFVWESADDLTGNYHADGGVVVVAATIERARKLIITRARELKLPQFAHKGPDPEIGPPDLDLPIEASALTEERVIIMPDNGCC